MGYGHCPSAWSTDERDVCSPLFVGEFVDNGLQGEKTGVSNGCYMYAYLRLMCLPSPLLSRSDTAFSEPAKS